MSDTYYPKRTLKACVTNLLVVAALWAAFPAGAFAAVQITGSDVGLVSQMPGSANDYDFGDFGGVYASTFGTTYTLAKNLPDFSVTTIDQYSDNGQSTILSPAAVSIHTGMTYTFTTGDLNLATFTLGQSSTFNYGDFNVYVLYSNAPGFSLRDSSISLAPGSSATGTGATVVAVTDTNTDKTKGRVVEFNIMGASAGQEFALAANIRSGSSGEEIGAISFAPAAVPEPPACALIGLGLAALFTSGYFRRSKCLS